MTVYTVAARAGVSISTVSLAINHPSRVAEATRRRVLQAAADLGFRTGAAPSSSNRLRIAVAAPFSSYASYGRRLTGMLARARTAAVELTVHDLESAAAAESPLLEALPARGGVDGVIVMGVPMKRETAVRLGDGLPLVLLDVPDAPGRRVPAPLVLIDDEAGGAAIGEHLAALGHRRAVFLHEPQRSMRWVSAGLLRRRGIRSYLELVDGTVEEGADVAALLAPLLERAEAPTAIVANHDELAARAHRALAVLGRRAALTGYDDGPLAEALDLTTVRQPFEESGRAALDLLLSRIGGTGAVVQRVQLAPQLVVRGSTG